MHIRGEKKEAYQGEEAMKGMGWLLFIMIIVMIGTVFFSCHRENAKQEEYKKHPEKIKFEENELTLVFENEGVKVWLFSDLDHYVWYTDARGHTSWEEHHQTGKNSTTENISVSTTGN